MHLCGQYQNRNRHLRSWNRESLDWATWKSMKYERTSTNPSYQAILLIPVFGIDGIRKEVEGETLSKSKWRRISMYGVEQFVPGGTAAQCWFEFKYTSTGRKKSWPNEASKIRRRYALNKRHWSWYIFSQQQYHHIVESIFISMRVLQPAHNTPIRLGHSEFWKEQSKKLWVQIQIQFWLEYLVHFGCDTSKGQASTY